MEQSIIIYSLTAIVFALSYFLYKAKKELRDTRDIAINRYHLYLKIMRENPQLASNKEYDEKTFDILGKHNLQKIWESTEIK